MSQNSAQPSLQTFQKTLVIGLGTTGARICEAIAHRVEGEYGGLDNRPWLRLCAFDTKKVAGTLIGDRGLAVHLPLDDRSWKAMIQRPTEYGSINFNGWYDPGTLSGVEDVTDGAGHVRMVGRAWFLHPDVFKVFAAHIQQEITSLQGLSTGTGPDGNPVAFDPQVAIFVVGALAGGTCSGCFIDVGYYLRTQFAVAPKVVGVFGIPHPDSTDVQEKANSYAALKELNHFHTCGGLQTRFCTDMDDRPVMAFPYDSFFLTQPRASQAAANQNDPIRVVNSAVAQMICLNAFSQCTAALRGEMINVNNTLANNRDRAGRPHSYGTIGLGQIEFPAAHVAAACQYRLAAKAVEDLLAVVPPPPDTLAGLLEIQLGLNEHAFRRVLLQDEQGETFAARCEGAIQDGHLAATDGEIPPLRDAYASLEYRLATAPDPNRSDTPGYFRERIHTNGLALVARKRREILDLVEKSITEPEKGPVWCVSFARALRDHLAQAVQDDPGQELQGAQADVNRAITNIEQTNESLLVRCSPGYKRLALNHFLAEWHSASERYWRHRLNLACRPTVQRALTELSALAETLVKRLEGSTSSAGALPWLRNLGTEFRRLHEELDGTGPVVSGELLFVRRKTVDDEYRRCLPVDSRGASPSEDLASREFAASWTDLAFQLTATTSRFDDRPGANMATVNLPTPSEVREVSGRLATPFDSIRSVSVLDRWHAKGDTQRTSDLNSLSRAALRFLDLDDARAARQDMAGAYDPSQSRFAFFKEAGGASDGTPAGQVTDHLKHLVPIGERVESEHFIPMNDPYKIVVMEARTNFPLVQVGGLQPGMRDGFRVAFEALSAARDDGAAPTLHSRVDRTWRGIEGMGDGTRVQTLVGKILLALALKVLQVDPQSKSIALQYPGSGYRNRGGLLELPLALESAAYELNERQTAADHLATLIDPALTSPQDRQAMAINDFHEDIGSLGLTLHGQPIANEEGYFAAIEPVVEANPPLKAMLDELSRHGVQV